MIHDKLGFGPRSIKPAFLEPEDDGWLNRSLGIEVSGPAPESAPHSWPVWPRLKSG